MPAGGPEEASKCLEMLIRGSLVARDGYGISRHVSARARRQRKL
jgi:hypothetical protein